ncbi:MAG: ArsR family transcriptional regulator [Nitrospiraceae bacterium]|nr:MAG: ArsR family transcriptional regulator [Nitrospiraceae bacterium]
MLDSLITSKTRIKLLLKFFLNPETSAYLRGLADELGESTNAVRVELNRLSKAGLLESRSDGRTKLYRANTGHSLFPDLHSVVRKFLGIDKVEAILNDLGTVEISFITGDYARGIDSGIIDLVIVGEIDRAYLQHLVGKAEDAIKRKIRVLVLNREEYERLKEQLRIDKAIVVWNTETEKTIRKNLSE